MYFNQTQAKLNKKLHKNRKNEQNFATAFGCNVEIDSNKLCLTPFLQSWKKCDLLHHLIFFPEE